MCHHNQDSHEEEFLDLAGGKKEYVVTLSAIIEDAKMKGLERVTYLPIVKNQRNKVIIKIMKEKKNNYAIKKAK